MFIKLIPETIFSKIPLLTSSTCDVSELQCCNSDAFFCTLQL